MTPREGEAAEDSPQRTQRTQRANAKEIKRRITGASQRRRFRVSPGGATDGSQGWSAAQPLETGTQPIAKPRRGACTVTVRSIAPPGLRFVLPRGPGVSLAFGSLHPWLPSDAPP